MQNSATLFSFTPRWRWLMLLHVAICSIGLVKLAMIAGTQLYNAQFLDFAISKLGDSAWEVGIGKLGSFLQYLFGLAFLPIFYGLMFLIMAFGQWRRSLWSQNKIILIVYFMINSIFTFRLFYSGASLPEWLSIWLLLTFSLPLLCFGLPRLRIFIIPKWLIWALVACLLVQLWLIFQPLIFKTMLVENDFMDMPGQTRLSTGQLVDNTQFINQHNIGGVVKYDPRINRGMTPLPRQDTAVIVKNTSLLNDFFEANIHDAKYRYTYYPAIGLLASKSIILGDDYQLLKNAFPDMSDKIQIDKLYLLALKQKTFYEHRVYTPLEWEFIQKNRLELTDQARTGWFFYHHNYFFSPILAISLGDPVKNHVLVYGWLNTYLFVKLLPYLGGVNYHSYFKLFFSIYPLYYFSFFLAILMIFKRSEYVLLGAMLAIASLFLLGPELIRLAPGYNPIRHFLDVFVLISFYYYIKKQKWYWLFISLALSILAILCNKEFGAFLLFAVSVAAFSHELVLKKRLTLNLWMVFSAAILGLYFYFGALPGGNPNFSYTLLGEGSPPTPALYIKCLLLLNAFLFFLMLVFRQVKDPIHYFWLCIVFYCQFALIYFIWYPMANHLLDIAPLFILLVLCLIYLSIRFFHRELNDKRILTVLLSSVFLFVYLPSAACFYGASRFYENNFKTHQLYEWPFETARLVSTINPQLFENAVDLINQYESHSGIYIISRYDDLLPTLAGKYSRMPYAELLTNLVTDNDVDTVVALVKKNKPLYLFIDTDINRSFNNEIYDSNDVLSKRYQLYLFSADRARVLKRLQLVYLGVKDEYTAIDKGELVTVYKRNQG